MSEERTVSSTGGAKGVKPEVFHQIQAMKASVLLI